MSKQNEAKGTCLCGGVTILANLEKKSFDACHCGICRKWGGGPALTVDGGDNGRFGLRKYPKTNSTVPLPAMHPATNQLTARFIMKEVSCFISLDSSECKGSHHDPVLILE